MRVGGVVWSRLAALVQMEGEWKEAWPSHPLLQGLPCTHWPLTTRGSGRPSDRLSLTCLPCARKHPRSGVGGVRQAEGDFLIPHLCYFYTMPRNRVGGKMGFKDLNLLPFLVGKKTLGKS